MKTGDNKNMDLLFDRYGIIEEDMYDLADFFKIFGESTRLRILMMLTIGERNVGDIADMLGMSHSAISHQLRVLKQARLVKSRREGKENHYSLADEHIDMIIKAGFDHIRE